MELHHAGEDQVGIKPGKAREQITESEEKRVLL